LQHPPHSAPRYTAGFRLRLLHGCTLIFGRIEPGDIRHFLHDCPGAVLDLELATLARASIALGTPQDLDALKMQIRESPPVFLSLNTHP
jgi:hypothetical protein